MSGIAVVYIFPGQGYLNQAVRFLQTYHDYPPGMDHQTVVVCNGVPADDETRFLFGSLPNLKLIEHDNSGKDCGGYQLAARVVPAEMMVFFGAETYFRRAGWLSRMAEIFGKYGHDHLYGATGNQGDARFNVYPHIRTTAFFCRPSLVNDCPLKVTHNELRYLWEHGPDGLTSWTIKQGKRAWVVGWDCVFPLHECNNMPGGFHNGTQFNLLVGDRLCRIPYGADP